MQVENKKISLALLVGMCYTLHMETPKQKLKADIKHLRQAARCSCDSYIGRMTRQQLNRQADSKERELTK